MDAERHEAAALDRRILGFLDGAARYWHADSAELNELLLAVFAHQARWNPAYARYAAARGAVPDRLTRWQEIPPVPARAFGQMRWATFPPAAAVRAFRSSGTTGGPRAELELDTLDLYDAALLPNFARHLLPDRASLTWVALVPDPNEVTDSSLAYMIGSAAARLGASPTYWVRGGTLDHQGAIAALAAHASAREPVLLLGTAIALLALTDALAAAGKTIELPPKSRIMETGGFKGRSRAVERPELYRVLADRLGVPVHAIVGEYGMTEMVSQFYDSTLADATRSGAGSGAGLLPAGDPQAPRLKTPPPWVVTVVLDAQTLEPVGEDGEGVLLHLDPAARSSAVALLTEDRGRRWGDGFELLGRMPGAASRGCSLALDDILRLSVNS
jgi:hypothetical protein